MVIPLQLHAAMKKSFDKKTHKYLIDGKPATGVTTIINVLAKPQLISWAARMAVEYIADSWKDKTTIDWTLQSERNILEEAKSAHTKKKEAAGAHGTDTHALVEEWINDIIEGETIDGNKFEPIAPFIEWANKNVDVFLFAERQMYNKELFIAGTADFAYIGKDGKKYMADFKTSSGIYGIDYWLQVAAYKMLAEGEGDEQYDGCTVVRLGKDGAFEVQHLYDYETYKEAFLCCLKLYRAQAAIADTVVKGE